MGCVPFQVPRDVRSTWPTLGVPVTRGAVTLLGATFGAADDGSATVAAKMPPTTAKAAAPPRIAR